MTCSHLSEDFVDFIVWDHLGSAMQCCSLRSWAQNWWILGADVHCCFGEALLRRLPWPLAVILMEDQEEERRITNNRKTMINMYSIEMQREQTFSVWWNSQGSQLVTSAIYIAEGLIRFCLDDGCLSIGESSRLHLARTNMRCRILVGVLACTPPGFHGLCCSNIVPWLWLWSNVSGVGDDRKTLTSQAVFVLTWR